MFDKLNYIELSGEKYPYKCDLFLLEKIQEEYKDLSAYENMLTGFTPQRDDNGEIVRNEAGLMVGTYETPNIGFLKEALYNMISEGIEIAKEEGEEYELIDKDSILRKVDMSPRELSELLHEEFSRCFVRKNPKTTQGKTEKKETEKK